MDIKYNPFGDSTNTYYSGGVADGEDSKGATRNIVITVSLVALSIIIVGYSLVFFSVISQKSETDRSIDEFNDSLAAVHATFQDKDMQRQLRQSAKEEKQLGDYADKKGIISNELIARLSEKLGEDTPQYDKHGDDMKESVKISSYYAICDIARTSVDTESYNPRSICSDFEKKARTMMNSVKSYNRSANSWRGTVTFHSDTYADIMKDQ